MFKFFNGGCEMRTCGEQGLALSGKCVYIQDNKYRRRLLTHTKPAYSASTIELVHVTDALVNHTGLQDYNL